MSPTTRYAEHWPFRIKYAALPGSPSLTMTVSAGREERGRSHEPRWKVSTSRFSSSTDGWREAGSNDSARRAMRESSGGTRPGGASRSGGVIWGGGRRIQMARTISGVSGGCPVKIW